MSQRRIRSVILEYHDGYIERLSPEDALERLDEEEPEDDVLVEVLPGDAAAPVVNKGFLDSQTPYFADILSDEGHSLERGFPKRTWSEALDAGLVRADNLVHAGDDTVRTIKVYKWTRNGIVLAPQRGSVRVRKRTAWHIEA